jgi:hypothetical protein
MPLKKIFATMPRPILVMFVVFLLTPLVSLTFIDKPWNVYHHDGPWRAAVVTVTYWILPWSLCYAIAFKHYFFLPLYLLQCLSLVLHSFVYRDIFPLDISMARYVLVGFMAYIGLFFGNKDFLYPFLTKDYRVWRKSPRYRINYDIYLIGDRPEHKIPAMIRDCSASGLFVIIDPRHVHSFLKKKLEKDKVKAVIRWLGQEHAVNAEIVWSNASGEARHLGLRVVDNESLTPFISWVKGELAYESKLLHTATTLLEHDIHQTALMFWVLFIALSFGLPAFAGM